MRAPAPDLSPTEIASAAGHALNNVLAYLYAASSYLDDGDVDAARARTAIEDACHGARSLSAALSLLGMTRDNVADVPAFLGALASALKPGGLLVMSTLNRTLRSYAAAIIGAEYIMRWLPKGTHDWSKFVRPEDLERGLNDAGLHVLETRGMVPDPFRGGWRLADDTAVNYILAAVRAQ